MAKAPVTATTLPATTVATPAAVPAAHLTYVGTVPAAQPRAPGSFGPGTVPGVCLAAMGAQGGATIATMQALVAALGRKGGHPVQAMLSRFAKVHGYTCTPNASGHYTYTAPALPAK